MCSKDPALPDQEIYLLIGYPKTATTFLQKEVFPILPNIRYRRALEGETAEPILKKIMYEILDETDAADIHRQILSSPEGTRSIFVQEVLATGGFRYFFKDLEQRRQALLNIKKIFKNEQLKIMLGIREPYDIIRSFYLLYLHKGGYQSFEDFLGLVNDGGNISCQGLFFDLFDYKVYIQLLHDLFEKENVYVYLFEDLKKDPPSFVRQILRFLNEPDDLEVHYRTHNRGYGMFEVNISRWLNRYFKSSENQEGWLPPLKLPGLGSVGHRRFFQSKFFPKFFYKRFELSDQWKTMIAQRYGNAYADLI